MPVTLSNGTEHSLRRLKVPDIFSLCRIVKKIGFKAPRVEKGMTSEQVGAEVITQVVNGLGDAEAEITAWLSSLVEMDVKDFRELDVQDIFAVFGELARDPNLGSFFQRALASMK